MTEVSTGYGYDDGYDGYGHGYSGGPMRNSHSYRSSGPYGGSGPFTGQFNLLNVFIGGWGSSYSGGYGGYGDRYDDEYNDGYGGYGHGYGRY